MTECYSCGGEYQNVAGHWARTDCSYPEPTERQSEIITGLMMGDASINNSGKGNPYLQIEMINEEFLNWVHDELGTLSSSVRLVCTGEEQAERTGFNECNDVYKLVSRRNPNLSKWADWYETGEKIFPEIEPTPTVFGIWYSCDGWIARKEGSMSPTVEISSVNERHRKDEILEMFKDLGFSCSWIRNRVHLHVDSSKDFWEWAEQPPGFEHKWDA